MNCWWACPSSEKTPPKKENICLLDVFWVGGSWVPSLSSLSSLSGQTGSYVASSVDSLAHALGLRRFFSPEGCPQRRGTGFTLGVWENSPLSRMSSCNTPSCCFFFSRLFIPVEHPRKKWRKNSPLGKGGWSHLIWKFGESLVAEVERLGGLWWFWNSFYKIDNEVIDWFTVFH